MELDWRQISSYLSVPGTNNPVFYTDGTLKDESGELKFTVDGHVVDFIGKASGENEGSTSQLEYWESSKPALRLPNHPVQVQFAQQRFEYLDRHIPFENVQIGLDVGCGNGVGTVSLRARVNTVFGLDMSSYLLSQMPNNIIGIRGDASRLPLRDNSVDFSMTWELIHHIRDPVFVLREMRRVTRRWVVLFEPNRWNPLLAGFSLAVPEERLALRNSRAYLVKVAEKAGLNIVHYATVGCIFPNKSPLWLATILAKLPFKIPYLGISHLLVAEVC